MTNEQPKPKLKLQRNGLPQLSDEEWASWKEHPVTVAFMRWMVVRREDLKDQWAEGHFTHDTEFGWAAAEARAIGKAQALRDIIELELGDLYEE